MAQKKWNVVMLENVRNTENDENVQNLNFLIYYFTKYPLKHDIYRVEKGYRNKMNLFSIVSR